MASGGKPSKKAAKAKPTKKTRSTKAPSRAPVGDQVNKSATSTFKRIRNRVFKTLVIIAVVLCLLPVILTGLYSSSSVHPVSTLMIGRWLSGQPVERRWVGISEVSPFIYQSVVSSEDGQYCTHNGVDWDAVNLVVDDLIDGERPRGASTIPMQTVKNVFLWSSRSYVRKVLEVPLALLTDFIWSKRRMMEIYLNIAEWGPGIFGIEAAAQHHFGRSAKKLTRKQAALLAVTLPNPILRNPRKPKRGLRRLARLVERRARQSGAYVKCLR